jgi:lambda family phage portal protein
MSVFRDALRVATGDDLGAVVRSSVRQMGGSRMYGAQMTGRLTNDWTTTSRPQYAIVRRGLRILRARSREQWMSNPYVRRFGNLLKENVIGPHGVRLLPRSESSPGVKNKAANDAIKDSFSEWGRKENAPEASGMSWRDAEKLFIESVARDGEVIIQHMEGTKANRWAYQFKFIDPELLDVWLNEQFPNGGGIIMGVEVDINRKPVAYHFLKDNISTSEAYAYGSGSRHTRVPADQIEHIWAAEWVMQTRGVPWTSTALWRCGMLNGSQEAELVAQRLAASKMGFYERTPDWAGEGNEFEGSGESTPEGDILDEAEPGHFSILPEGYKFTAWDPTHPNANAPDFTKLMLRGIASGLGASYNTLGNDMEGPNFGSLRVGLLSERDVWMITQQWSIEHFHDVIYRRWLRMSLLAGRIKPDKGSALSFADLEKYQKVFWQPRSWAWIDPQKEMTAAQMEIDNLLSSRSEWIRAKGKDPEEVFTEISEENKLFEELGISPNTAPDKQTAGAAQDTDAEGNAVDADGHQVDENGDKKLDENDKPIPGVGSDDDASGKQSGKAGAAAKK